MKPDTFTTAEFQNIFTRLEELNDGLAKMLDEYQPEARENVIKVLQSFCDPVSILSDFSPCVEIFLEDPKDVDELMRSIRLEKELIQCKKANKLITHWSGIPEFDVYGEGFHPWINEDPDYEIPAFSMYPKGLSYCYETIISSYYQCMGITSRRWAWDFYRTSIFRQAGVRSPALAIDLEKWEEMQRVYFDSRKLRREFLQNMYQALYPNYGTATAFDDEDGRLSSGEDINPSLYGFVYLIRNGDLAKIGITENLLRRMDQLKPDEVLNVVRCKNYRELEKDLHSLFKDVRLPQTEYFRLSEEQIIKVHKLMTSLADF